MSVMMCPPPTDRATDAALVDLARGGDREAFSELIRRHYGEAEGVCLRALGEEGMAKDAVQEATLTAWLGVDRLHHPDRFGPWLCGIACSTTCCPSPSGEADAVAKRYPEHRRRHPGPLR